MFKEWVKKVVKHWKEKKTEIIGIDPAAGDDKTAEIKFTTEEATKVVEIATGLAKQAGISVETAAEAIKNAMMAEKADVREAEKAIRRQQEQENRENTNNWRKMHGLPMRRKKTGEKREKQ